ncbi:unnamed protein product [Prunus brigantina]
MASSLEIKSHPKINHAKPDDEITKEEEDESFCYAIQLVGSYVLSMSLQSAIELGVFDIIAQTVKHGVWLEMCAHGLEHGWRLGRAGRFEPTCAGLKVKAGRRQAWCAKWACAGASGLELRQEEDGLGARRGLRMLMLGLARGVGYACCCLLTMSSEDGSKSPSSQVPLYLWGGSLVYIKRFVANLHPITTEAQFQKWRAAYASAILDDMHVKLAKP